MANGYIPMNRETATYSALDKASTVTGSVLLDRSGNVFSVRIDVTFTSTGSGWNEVATMTSPPSRNIYGVVSTTAGACKLVSVTYTGKVQILAPTANVEYLGTVTGIM